MAGVPKGDGSPTTPQLSRLRGEKVLAETRYEGRAERAASARLKIRGRLGADR